MKKKNEFAENIFYGEYDESNEIYSNFCNTICRVGLAHRIDIVTHSEEINDHDCFCCGYTITRVENIRVVMRMDGEHEMGEWYDYECE